MSDSGFQPGPVRRPVGLETEFGILRPGDPYANPVVLSSQVVEAYCTAADVPAVRWDYEGEDPLADLRGGRLQRSVAHPSQLTDDPTRPAPSGDAQPPAPWGSRARPSAAEAALPHATTAVLVNGARMYVDHAHPEYSSPEVLTPHDALVWDRAGEVVARSAMEGLGDGARGAGAPVEIVLYKNNVDGKGAAYGCHENYLVRRDLAFDDLVQALIPFLVTRPVLVGAGRVGIGQRSQRPGFQISQRADYVETDIGLQTTFNRPIVNTRDEPHADASRFRRLHVINGDANRFDVPDYLKIATTDLLLWYLERASARGRRLGALGRVRLTGDPVEEHWAVSHDTALAHALATACGPMTALEIQRAHLAAVVGALCEDYGGVEPGHVGEETAAAIALWDETLSVLEGYAAAQGTPGGPGATARAAALVEWIAKKQLCDALRMRTNAGWDDPRLTALDIRWADLRAGHGIADRLIAAGRTRRLIADAEAEAAAGDPPPGTRAAIRGAAVARDGAVVAASWTSLVLDLPDRERLLRLALPDDVRADPEQVADMLDQITITIGTRRRSGGD